MIFIYFIQEGRQGNIKIGISSNPERRLRGLQTGNPSDLNLLFHMPGDRFLEQCLHEKFRYHHISGEWFKPSADIFRHIAICKNAVDENLLPLHYGLCVFAEVDTPPFLVFKDNDHDEDHDIVYANDPLISGYTCPSRNLFSIEEMHDEEVLWAYPGMIQWLFDPRSTEAQSQNTVIGIGSGYEGPAIWHQDSISPTLCKIQTSDGVKASIFDGDEYQQVEVADLQHPGDPPKDDGPIDVPVSTLKRLLGFTNILVSHRIESQSSQFFRNLAEAVVASAKVELGMRSRRSAALEMWGWSAVSTYEKKFGSLR